MLKIAHTAATPCTYTAIESNKNLAAGEMPLKWIGLKGGPSFLG